MPSFRFNKALNVARGAKVFLNLESGVTRGPTPNGGGAPKNARQGAKKLRSRDRQISRLREKLRAAKEQRYAESGLTDEALSEVMRYEERTETLRDARERINRQKSMLKSKNWEIFQLKNELRAAKERLESLPDANADELEVGALPDFMLIGGMRCGTTTLYHLLTQHPLVERAATKELHFFDNQFEKGAEWYRRCFPPPQQRDGRRTITGEGSPKYLYHAAVPERAAQVVPGAKLIVLVRNPVNRTYSNYHHQVSNGHETRTFEKAIEEALRAEEAENGDRTRDVEGEPPESRYLKRSIYVDQLQRWSKFFDREQMLVLQSEDFFERTSHNLNRVFGFLGLPEWEPEVKESETSGVRNKGKYSRGMDPETRRRLQEYFEPHNQRLYEYLGTDFGW